VETSPLTSSGVRHFVKAAVADKTAVREYQIGLLAHDALLDLEYLRDVVGARLEFGRLDALIYAHQEVLIDVGAIIDPS